MKQQQHRALAHLLHVPAHAAGLHEAARFAQRPVEAVALPDQSFCQRGRSGELLAARTACDKVAAPACGKGR